MRGPSPLTVLDAGRAEQALHDAVAVCALFSFMNLRQRTGRHC